MHKEKIKIGTYSPGLGDYLLFTPIFKVLHNCEMVLYEHPKSRKNSRVFDGLCDVSFTSDKESLTCIESNHPNTAQKKIEGLGIDHLCNCIPQIEITPTEKKWAEQCLKPYGDCIAFVADTGGSWDENDKASRYRMYSYWEKILQEYRKRYCVLQFGLSGKISKLQNVDYVIEDLSVRELAASYWYIGRYLGVNTGDYNLMLSVGGRTNVLIPPDNHFYQHKYWDYTPELWKNEPIRIKYFDFQEAEKCIDYINFEY